MFEFTTSPMFWFGLVFIVLLKTSIKFVPQNRAYVTERFGKYSRTLSAGLNFIVPFIEKVAYERSLKEQALDVPQQTAITRDNITLGIDGVLYLKVIDPYKASYGVEDYFFAVSQLAQTTMRSEIGKIDLDKTFEDRETLNVSIVSTINDAADAWGVQVLRYEVKDIIPPRTVLDAMEQQMRAEREKRAVILESEGARQSAINVAEGEKEARIKKAEADKREQELSAEGEANAIRYVADARAEALKKVGEAASTTEGKNAVRLQIAEGAIDARKAIATPSAGKLILLDGGKSEVANAVTEALGIATAINTIK